LSRTILFVFAGRRPNMHLQLPFIHRILDENPQVEYHIWNLCRDPADAAYLHTIAGERITVRDDFYQRQPGWNDVYRHYTRAEYEDCLFVKLDDDVVFLETARFADFVDAVAENAGVVLSANIVNNGACTPLNPGLHKGFKKLALPLLDAHTSNGFAEMSHRYFFEHADELLNQQVQLIPTKDWLSINLVGYDWETGCRITAKLETPHPLRVAGRMFPPGWELGDEGCMNMFPRVIMRGFVAGHLTFGPQTPIPRQLRRWRGWYASLGERYLLGDPSLRHGRSTAPSSASTP
jgi:hypothetical protein